MLSKLVKHSTLFLFALGLGLSSTALQGATIGVIGDSISTGAVTNGSLAFDVDRMHAVLTGKAPLGVDEATLEFLKAEGAQNASQVKRVDLSPREFVHPLVWMFNRFVLSLSNQYIDTVDNSWVSLFAKLRGGDQVYIAAKDGEKAMHAVQQVDRLLDGVPGEALDHLFVFFTGNDICAPYAELLTRPEDYQGDIEKAVRYYMKNAKPKASGDITHIWLVTPLNVSQLVTSKEIQEKRIFAFGKERSCKELQTDDFDKNLSMTASAEDNKDNLGLRPILTQVFQGGPYGLCPTLFAYQKDGSLETLKPVANALADFREKMGMLAKSLNEVNPSFRVQALSSASPIEFKSEDIANDCFHLSTKGQLRIAKALREEVEAKSQP